LSCGHIFHVPCIEEWLNKKCTCPICNFELETDDSEYERDRVRRMRERKPRYRRDELDKKSVLQLRDIAKGLAVDTTGCIDKCEVVERIIASDKVHIVESVPPLEITTARLQATSVQELRHLLLSYGLSTTGAIEKSELVQRLLESGRVIIVDKPDSNLSTSATTSASPSCCKASAQSPSKSRYDSGSNLNSNRCSPSLPAKPSAYSPSSKPSPSHNSPPPPSSSSSSSGRHSFEIHENSLKQMSIRELKSIMTSFGISYVGCVEREDLIGRFEASPDVKIVKTVS